MNDGGLEPIDVVHVKLISLPLLMKSSGLPRILALETAWEKRGEIAYTKNQWVEVITVQNNLCRQIILELRYLRGEIFRVQFCRRRDETAEEIRRKSSPPKDIMPDCWLEGILRWLLCSAILKISIEIIYIEDCKDFTMKLVSSFV